MSTNKVAMDAYAYEEVCASCGIAAVDDITLKFCDGCDLVKYCSVECQENHREKHEEDCKKRKDKLHGKKLFTQNDSSYWGECPICCLPLSLDAGKSIMMGCCSKSVCKGCCYANKKREVQAGLEHRCTFCREPLSKSKEQSVKRIMERVKKNDPMAMTRMGQKNYVIGEYGKALEYYTKAAKLGGVAAHACLGDLYREGNGVEKDEKKAVYHWEQAAICGHPGARGLLASHEMENGRPDRAAKHLIINANLGCDTPVKMIKDFFVQGVVSKEDYAAALRGCQAAMNETKSAERDKAEAFYARN